MTTIKDHKAAKEEDKENLNPQTHTTFVPLLGDLHLDSPGMDGRALVEETSNVKIAENETSETTVASMKVRIQEEKQEMEAVESSCRVLDRSSHFARTLSPSHTPHTTES
jgi:hypothetical protein